ncbi:Carboxylic ester hydrolase [Photobacterium marinum]|uniref:Carboxylic ester hydrolase n=1 Tax=Photobacterium marinum TaxID=1056511 RepID=L8JHI0_9GAMM|nr:carboxylic ester hydrolase [Photobacterium marinum]ELR67703.1 Carboxylic ester hydrolase [Photobacterium marinum]
MLLLMVGLMLIPPPEMPQPDGPHKVGVTEFEVGDVSQRVHIMAWYPAADTAKGQHLPYTESYVAEALSAQQGLPPALLHDERPSSSIIDGQILAGKHPVLLFNHGYGSHAMQNLTNMEQLASHGYIVMSLGHPGHSLVVKMLNGDLVQQKPEVAFDPELLTAEYGNKIATYTEKLRKSASLDEWQQKMQQYEQVMMNDAVGYFGRWVKNNQQLLDALPDIASSQQKTLFGGHLDLDRVAAFGHSFGGAVASHLVMNDERVKAGINLDGQLFSFSVNPESRAPLCIAYSTDNQLAGIAQDFSWVNSQVVKASAGGGCEAQFTGAAHMNFSDLNYVTPLKYAGILGAIDSNVMHKATNGLLVGFFNQYLRGGEPMQAPADVEFRMY